MKNHLKDGVGTATPQLICKQQAAGLANQLNRQVL